MSFEKNDKKTLVNLKKSINPTVRNLFDKKGENIFKIRTQFLGPGELQEMAPRA